MEKVKSYSFIALSVVNRSYKTPMTREKLAGYLKKGVFPAPDEIPEREQVEVFFTELDAETILGFCRENGISSAELKAYYERFVKPVCRNLTLEEYLFDE